LVDYIGNELYNTATIPTPSKHRKDTPLQSSPFTWKCWLEPLLANETSYLPYFLGDTPYEQNSITYPPLWTQYVYYQTNFTANSSLLTIQFGGQMANGYLLYLDGQFVSTVQNLNHSFEYGAVNFTFPTFLGVYGMQHQLLILSESFGNDNSLAVDSPKKSKGITGGVLINDVNITNGVWKMQVGLAGEILQVYTPAGAAKMVWNSDWTVCQGLTAWFQTHFPGPADLQPGEVLLLKITQGVGRGHFYLNGHDLGRYYSILMNDGSGRETQSMYVIPRQWMNLYGLDNVLTLGEVLGASDLPSIMIYRRIMVSGPPPPPPFQDPYVICPM